MARTSSTGTMSSTEDVDDKNGNDKNENVTFQTQSTFWWWLAIISSR